MMIQKIFKRFKKGSDNMMTLEEFENRTKRVRILKHKIDDMRIFKDEIMCDKTVRVSYQPYGSSNDRVEYVDGFCIKRACEEYYKNIVNEYNEEIKELRDHGLLIRSGIEGEI